jgi:hypothetical protein
MEVEKYNKPMTAVLGMYKTDFHAIELQCTIYNLLQSQALGLAETRSEGRTWVRADLYNIEATQ